MAEDGTTKEPSSLRNSHLRLEDRVALRIDEAAIALGICERSIRNHLHEIPHFRLGRSLRFPARELMKWAADRSSASEIDTEQEVVEELWDNIVSKNT